MNILMLDKYLTVGGVATFLETISKGLQDRGHNIYLITGEDGKNKNLIKQFKNHGITVFTVRATNNRLISFFRFVRSMLSLLKNEQIDIIHSHHRLTHFAAIAAGKIRGVPRLLTLHVFKKDHKLLTKLWEKETLTVPSRALKKELIDHYGLQASHIHVIHNAISSDFKINPKLVSLLKKNVFSNRELFYVTYIGRLSHEKGVDHLINSIPIVAKQNSRIAFRIFGDGPELSALKRQSKKLDLNPDLIFHGTNTNINELLSLTDLCVIPSRSESFSLFALESLRAGVPVIAAKIGGIPEVVSDGETGLLTHFVDPEALAEHILALCKNEAMRQHFAKKSKERFEHKFSTESFYEAYIAQYRTLIKDINA